MAHYVQMYSGAHAYQTGRGKEDIEVYRGPLYRQSGAGIGDFLRSAATYVRPILSSGLNALKDQSLHSAGSVISQLGRKELKTILKEESEKVVRDSCEKAINKLKQSRGEVNNTQTGSGMIPYGVSPLQIQQLLNEAAKKKPIKRRKSKKRGQSGQGRKRKKTSKQVGRGKKSKKSCAQIGKGRKKKSKSKKSKFLLQKPRGYRNIDIFQ